MIDKDKAAAHAEHFAACAMAARERGDLDAARYYQALSDRQATIAQAMRDIEMSNNGWIPRPTDPAVVDALRSAGYVVTLEQVMTPKAQSAIRADATHYPTPPSVMRMLFCDGPDYESMILERQDRQMGGY